MQPPHRLLPAALREPVTKRMHQNFTRLTVGLTVGDALDWLRQNPPPGQVIYFYVVDEEGQLQGVVPTRRLLLSQPETPLTDIMIRKMVLVPAHATVLDACEFFVQHRLLAFPVVDSDGRILGVVDIDLYTDALAHLEHRSPIGRLVAPLAQFMRIEASSGLVLLFCTAIALVLANSPWASAFEAFWETKIDLVIGGFSLARLADHPDLRHLLINDGLMALFFFVVGLEIKRELTSGELADPRKALLPVLAALGGMIAPALVFLICLAGREGMSGWAVPTATDIAFVVGVLTLFGSRVPHGLKVMLLTLAIADDIGAVLVIALFYSGDISFMFLGLAGAGMVLVMVMRWLGFRDFGPYLIMGAGVWLMLLQSGVHPTIAGVVLGLLTPVRGLARRLPVDVVGDLANRLVGHQGEPGQDYEPYSPLDRLEHALHPWVAFVIMPIFALANAGVKIEMSELATPVAMAVAAGLLVGKPVGIFLFSWGAVRMGLVRLPTGVSWSVLSSGACLGGIGFTMALFIAGLAFEEGSALHDQAKIGILTGSLLSTALGSVLLLLVTLPRQVQNVERIGEADSP